MSKVNQAFGEGGGGRFGPTDGTRLPPIEVSPQSIDTSQYGSLPVMSSSDLEHVEKLIIQNMADMNVDSSEECGATDDDQASVERRLSTDPAAEWKKRAAPQSRRSDVSEEMISKMNASSVEGGRQSRPSDLPLFNDNNGRPMPIPRSQSNRNQRLLSVPNIQYNRSISEHVRSKSRKEPISIAANLMRRFSKYPS